MKIHEYQAKEILKEYGISVPAGRVVATPEEAESAALELGCPVVVKAQIHAGGRGKAGGVITADSPARAKELTSQLLGKYLRTAQTPGKGMLVSKVLIQKMVRIRKEYYFSISIDRKTACPIIITSDAGGTSIEEIARDHPKRIHKECINPLKDPEGFNGGIFSNLYRLFKEKDCSLLEINPLALTVDNHVLALDAKIVFDDNALFRHPELKELADSTMEDPLELEAKKGGINYIRLSGNIGCMVNGAGLAMATMDTIKFFGGEPANFLDVGGGSSPEKIEIAFHILASDPSVKVIFINIFGGIFRCDFLAEALLRAYKKKQYNFPLVLRLDGTNASQGLKLLKNGKIKFHKEKNLTKGAKKAVEISQKGERKWFWWIKKLV